MEGSTKRLRGAAAGTVRSESVTKEGKAHTALQSTLTKDFTAHKSDHIHQDIYVKARLNFAVSVMYTEGERGED